MNQNIETKALLDLSHTMAAEYLSQFTYPWEALGGIKQEILRLGVLLPEEEYHCPRPDVWIHRTATVAPTAFIGDAVIIGPQAEIRHGAFIRGAALVGEGAVVGKSRAEAAGIAVIGGGVRIPAGGRVADGETVSE